MFCPGCGKEVKDDAKFCRSCGKPLMGVPAQESTTSPVGENTEAPAGGGMPEPKKGLPFAAKILIPILAIAVAGLAAYGIISSNKAKKEATPAAESAVSVSESVTPAPAGTATPEPAAPEAEETETDKPEAEPDEEPTPAAITVKSFTRPRLLSLIAGEPAREINVKPYTIESGLANVDVSPRLGLADPVREKLEKNGFVVFNNGYTSEFFDTYEMNRYRQVPSFITVDSMMHTYHLYFSYLLKNLERASLADTLAEVSRLMLKKSAEQLETLAGTEWESAAIRNTAFHAVGLRLLDENAEIPAAVNELVDSELARIKAAEGIEESLLFAEEMEDYTQYKPRGYYEGDAKLEAYFRAMMWYGRMNFKQSNEDFDRSALLTVLAMDEEVMPAWEKIYVVTSFFAGAADDNIYYEYRPILEAVYGADVTAKKLVGDGQSWITFHSLTGQTDPPAINSVPGEDDGTDKTATNKGFRFLGQRFSIDAAIFQNLVYNKVGANSAGENRMLPDALDIPAALGSDEAYKLLREMGETDYAGYEERMDQIRAGIADDAPLWSDSLYARWLYTLDPLTETKGEGYPFFMQSEEWAKKNLQTYLGSYTELKHDTVLYSKQMMVEMGGGDTEVLDDRGYVEVEPEVFARLAELVRATSEGLANYGILAAADKDNLDLLTQLAERLQTIAEKELREELPSDEDFEFIRDFGGSLEHFWQEVYKDEAKPDDYMDSRIFPAAVITDVATDPNGSVLQIGTGAVSDIFVVVPVDGKLRVTKGAVFSFYQFEQPINERLTDSDWRKMIGMEMDGNNYVRSDDVTQPAWVGSFTVTREDV